MHDHLNVRRAATLAAACLLLSCAPLFAAELEVFVVDPAFSPFNVAGRTATIRGVGFTPSTTVSFGATAATVAFVDSRTLTVTVPVIAAAAVRTVTVVDPANGQDAFYPFLHTGPVFYVSTTTGADSNNGTTPALAKATIINGLSVVDGVTPTEVRVAAGTYPEALIAVWTPVALSCGWSPDFTVRDPDARVVVIDAGGAGFAMRSAGIRGTSVIDGCTISNGLRDGLGGGGIAVTSDSTVVNNNVIVGNTSSIMGGGIYFTVNTAYGGTPTFSNNVILGNRAHNKNGGGISVYPNYNTQEPVRVNVTANEIVGNRSFGGRGGGFALSTSSYAGYNNGVLKMAENVLAHNVAKTGAGGTVTFYTFGDYYNVSFNNNLLFGNSAQGSGGGFAFEGTGMIDGTLASSTFAANSAVPGLTGGLLIGGALTLLPGFEAGDVIAWGNPGGDVGGQAGTTLTYSDAGTALPGAGNLSQDPEFASGPLGDFYLTQADPNQADSPALDAGSANASSLSLDPLTTRSDGVTDSGIADMGFHYPMADSGSAQPISILRIDPMKGDLNGTEWVLVRGDGFDPGATVRFGGVPAAAVRFLGNRRLLARPAAHAAGPVSVRVTNPEATFAETAGLYAYVDNQPPAWTSTVGVASAAGGQDCVRSAVLQWNPAFDLNSTPVSYEVHRQECVVSSGTTIPCDNFGYFPTAASLLATTFNLYYTDVAFSASGADKQWIYLVRARDGATPYNQEFNLARRLVTVGTDPSDVTPPPEVGETLEWVDGSTTQLVWSSASTGAIAYPLYRELAATPFGNPGTMTPFQVLTASNNDADANGVVDAAYTDAQVPAANGLYFYRVTVRDPCGNETLSELLP